MGENRQVDRASVPETQWGPEETVAPAAPLSRAVARDSNVVALPDRTISLPVIGYASCICDGAAAALELKQQAEVIARECKRRGFTLIEVVGERSPATGKGLARPGLTYALERISDGAANGLVVVELSRITSSVGELGDIIDRLMRLNVRFVSSADAFDTGDDGGHLAAALLIGVSRWERNRLSERTRNGLQAARMSGRAAGRPAVADDPDLSKRIAHMRAQGMTLQAIADRLNEEGVPTVRGGAKWRHSSVQAAAGYKRHQRPPLSVLEVLCPKEQSAG
jgi:DNA invertase Pin-like site-specific DNA recombinase